MCKVAGSGGVWFAPTIIAFATPAEPGVGGLFDRLLCDGSDEGDEPFVVVVPALLLSEVLLMRERASRRSVGSEYR